MSASPEYTTREVSSASFDLLLKEAVRAAGTLSAAEQDLIREDLRLRCELPGHYVAYFDHYRTCNGELRLDRELVAHSSRLLEVNQVIDGCPAEERRHLIVAFVDPLDDDLYLPLHAPED